MLFCSLVFKYKLLWIILIFQNYWFSELLFECFSIVEKTFSPTIDFTLRLWKTFTSCLRWTRVLTAWKIALPLHQLFSIDASSTGLATGPTAPYTKVINKPTNKFFKCQSPASPLFSSLQYLQLTVNNGSMKFADDCIRTADRSAHRSTSTALK